jgi:hypothetical protein
VTTFGAAQYQWHADVQGGTVDPDGPAEKTTINATPSTTFLLPVASVSVFRGNISK